MATENSLFMGQSLCAGETNHLLQNFFVGSISDDGCGLCHLEPLTLTSPLRSSRSRITIKLSRTANQTYLYSVKQRLTATWVPSALPSPPLFRHLIDFHHGLGQFGVVVFFSREDLDPREARVISALLSSAGQEPRGAISLLGHARGLLNLRN